MCYYFEMAATNKSILVKTPMGSTVFNAPENAILSWTFSIRGTLKIMCEPQGGGDPFVVGEFNVWNSVTFQEKD